MAEISIIVPIYKVEPYLKRCVDSILNQTYQDFELILVDDGSPDNCGAICDEYAQQDGRVVVIHKKNGGISDARNVGIEWSFAHSNSEWITFADSDDWMHPKLLEKLMEANEKFGTKVSICSHHDSVGDDVDYTVKEADPYLTTPVEHYKKLGWLANYAWGKLYHKSCFRTLRYPKGRTYEDQYVTYKVLFSQKQLAVYDEGYYAYFRNPDGITKVKWSVSRLAMLDAYWEQFEFFTENGYKELLSQSLSHYIYYCINNLRHIRKAKSPELKPHEEDVKQRLRTARKIASERKISLSPLYRRLVKTLIGKG